MMKTDILIILILAIFSGNIYAGDREIIKNCVKKLDYKTDLELDQALECIHSRMPKVAPILIDELENNPNPVIKQEIVRILEHYNIKKTIPGVLEMVNSKDERARRVATQALKDAQDEKMIPVLNRLTNDNDFWVRRLAMDAMVEFSKKQKVPPEVVIDLKGKIKNDFIMSPNPQIRQRGIFFAAELGAIEFVPIIEEIAQNDTFYEFIRVSNIRSLGPPKYEKKYPVRLGAENALKRLKPGYKSIREIGQALPKSTTTQ